MSFSRKVGIARTPRRSNVNRHLAHSRSCGYPLTKLDGRELNGTFRSLDESMNPGLLRHQWGSDDLDNCHPLFGQSNRSEVGRAFAGLVPSVSDHDKCVLTWSAFVRPLGVVELEREVAEEDGDLEESLRWVCPTWSR